MNKFASVLFLFFTLACGDVIDKPLVDADTVSPWIDADSTERDGAPVADAGREPDAGCLLPPGNSFVNFLGEGGQTGSVIYYDGFYLAAYPGLVAQSDLYGIGVSGGVHNLSIDNDESVLIIFDTKRTTNITVSVIGTRDENGDGIFGQHLVEAYDADCNRLGGFIGSGEGYKDVSALFDNRLISRVEFTGVNDRFRLGSVTFKCASCDCATVDYCGE